MRRRRLLALAGATIPATLAGCIETSTSDEESPEQDQAGDEENDQHDEDGENNEDGESEETEDDQEEWTEPDWPTGPYADYDTTIVEVKDEDGEVLGKVKAAVAHPGEQWTLGLSDAESMPENGAMLFESDSSSELTFWMRDMSFGLDIVYVSPDREITSIHHAPEPEEGDDGTEDKYQFSGRGQYVLEVNYGWTTDRGISEGDVLEFDLDS